MDFFLFHGKIYSGLEDLLDLGGPLLANLQLGRAFGLRAKHGVQVAPLLMKRRGASVLAPARRRPMQALHCRRINFRLARVWRQVRVSIPGLVRRRVTADTPRATGSRHWARTRRS